MNRQAITANLAVSHIVCGLVLHLNPQELINCGAKCSCDGKKQVTGDHFFLCLAHDKESSDWIPLYSNPGRGRLTISTTGRQGHPKWTAGTFHFHPEQVWTVSNAAVVAAAVQAGDRSMPGSRNLLDQAEIPVF